MFCLFGLFCCAYCFVGWRLVACVWLLSYDLSHCLLWVITFGGVAHNSCFWVS